METYLAGLLIFAFALILFSWGFGTFKKLQFIRNTPTSKIRSMAKGDIEISGKAKKLDGYLETPITKQKCLYYNYIVEEYQSNGKRSSWKTIDSGGGRAKFIVDDGTGISVVDPENATVDIPEKTQIKVSGGDKPPKNVQNFIEENEDVKEGSNEILTLADNRRRFKETYIEPNEELYIFGYSDNLVIDGESYNMVKDGGVPLFYISNKSEDEIRNEWGYKYKLSILASIVLTPFSVIMMGIATGIF